MAELLTMAEVEPFKRLAEAVLHAAVQDYKRILAGDSIFYVPQQDTNDPYMVTRAELVSFFQSGWCDDLCAMCGLDYEVFIERLGLQERKAKETPYWKRKQRERQLAAAGG